MIRRPTFSEQRWPMDAESVAQASVWAEGVAANVLDWTWRAFDCLRTDHLSKVDLSEPPEQLERNLAAMHFVEIIALWARETDGYSSVTPVPEWSELETRPAAPGRPPAYDFAFVYRANQRIAWPIEAKVVPKPETLSDYMGDVEKFVVGRAAPLTGEGGIIAYLLAGTEIQFLAAIERRLEQTLAPPEAKLLAGRAHRISHHARGKSPYLRLHHLAMSCARKQRK